MNKLILLITFTASIVNAYGPCGALMLDNIDANNGQGVPVYYLKEGTFAPSGQNIFVQVLAGPDVNSLTPATYTDNTPNIIPMGNSFSGNGFFDGGVGIVPGVVDNGLAAVQIRIWVGTSGFDDASQHYQSPTWTQITGVWDPDSLPQVLVGTPLQMPFTSMLITDVPEPSTIALGLMGAVALWGYRQWHGNMSHAKPHK